MTTDYSKIAESIRYWGRLGFQHIEVPWMVPSYFDEITRPKGAYPFLIRHDNQIKGLIGSAEQSLVYLGMHSRIPKGRYMAVTPCFRSDPEDNMHTQHFIKNELHDTTNTKRKDLEVVLTQAVHFFKIYVPDVKVVSVTDMNPYTQIAFDIMHNNIELGSYGIREHSGYRWLYGTACAEPRLSMAVTNGIS